MHRRIVTSWALCALLWSGSSATTALATAQERAKELPEKYRRWLEEEVTYIISKVERETFLSLETASEREAFIEAFWRRRDPNPSTLENEFREEHYRRLAYVNEFFGRDTFRPGWMTDRGRYYIILGPPRDRQDFSNEDAVYPTELWFYNNPELKRYGLPPFFYLLFFRRHGSGELELYSPGTDGPQELLTGYQYKSSDFRADVEAAYEKLYEISPELAHASISFRTDEGDIVQFQAPSFGTLALLEQIASAPLRGVDTSYAEHFYAEKGTIESDYLFNYVPSWTDTSVLPGPRKAYYLHWVIELDPQHVALVKDEDKHLYGSHFIVSAELTAHGEPERRVLTLRKDSFMTLRESQAQTGLTRPFSYAGVFPVIPGSYDVRIILRNRACSGREESTCRKSYTLLESTVDVPPWNERESHLSSLVLGYGAERPEGRAVYRPYRVGGVQLLPNPRRVYAIGDPLVVMTQVPNAGLSDQVRFRITSQEDPEQLHLEKTVAASGLSSGPLVQELSLEGFAGGRYRLTAELLDSRSRVVDTQVTQFTVTPRTAVARPFLRGSWSQVAPEIPGLVEMFLGEQYLHAHDKAKARELFTASVEANPRFGSAREALARLFLDEGTPAKALELLEPIYQSDPSRYEVLALMGEADFQQENYGKAVELLEKANALKPPDARLLGILARSHYELGHLEQARELFQRALALQPDQPEIEAFLKKLQSTNKP